MKTRAKVSLPVSVILARKMVSRGAWSVPSYRAVGVVAGDSLASIDAKGSLVREMDDERHYLWGGLKLELFRDSAGSYWTNLVGDEPALYVICHEREGGDLEPVLVTADPDEASATIEGSDPVFAASIPPEIYLGIEQFVVEHYKPTPPRKRKRKNWSERG
ncbi:MAG: DUF3305 domain-containing protein [Gammaproteobacteria bacterium]